MIDKLDFILALAREKHFGRAAEACGVTQPTLSAGVKHLEEQMGVLLVNRGSRFQSFTPEGQRVLDWARRIVGDTRAMREEINSLRHGLTGRLRIAAIPTTLPMVAALTTPYRERHPKSVHNLLLVKSLELLDNLRSTRHHLSRQRAARAPPRYRSTTALWLLTSADAPLESRQRNWPRLLRFRLPLTPDMQNRVIDRLPQAGGSATLESDSMILLFSHVRTGRGRRRPIAETLVSPTPSAPFRSPTRRRCRPSASWSRRASR